MAKERIDRERVNFGQAPPDDRDPYIPILSPAPEQTRKAVIVTPALVGVFTHFMGGRTGPCTGEAHGCVGCARHIPRRWKGYFGAYEGKYGRLVLVEVTHGAAIALLKLLKDRSLNFRGWNISVYRSKGARNAPVKAELTPGEFGDRGLPPAFDVAKALIRIWEGRKPDNFSEATLPLDESEETR